MVLQYVEIPVPPADPRELEDTESDLEGDMSLAACQDPVERQREVNDNLALILILDDPAPFGEFAPAASEPLLANSKQRRQTLLNFLAFCLARDGAPAALATTIQRRAHEPANQLVLHIARSTGSTPAHERERAHDFLRDLKRAWLFQTFGHMQIVLGHVVQMTAVKLRRRLTKLRVAMQDLRCADGFAAAVDAWGKEEVSPDVFRWKNTWHCESPTSALKDVFQQLSASVDADDFEAPDLFTVAGCFRIYHSYFFPIAVLIGSHFLREVEVGLTSLSPNVLRMLRRLRRRCMKLRWYETGVHLLCTYARDTVRRIIGADAFAKFLDRDDDALQFDWLETPDAVSVPMPRAYVSAQDALLGVLSSISDGSDGDEPFACTIAHRPAAEKYWTTWCTPVYHPELQVVDHLRKHGMRPSPTFIGGSRLACRACKFYVDQLDGGKWSLHAAGLDTMDLEVPNAWLVPPTDAGLVCASIVREEAARLVLREDNAQRIAWEMRYANEAMGCDLPQTGTVVDTSPVLDISS